MALDGLTDACDGLLDGRVDRAAQREAAASPARSRTRSPRASHQRAAAAQKNGHFAEEIAPVEIPQRKGDPIVVIAEDEGDPPGHHRRVAGQAAPGVRQGRHDHRRHARRRSPTAPRAVVVMSKAKAEELGLTWLAEIGAHGNVAGPDNSLHSQPSNAINARAAQGRPDRRRPRPDRDQRGVRRGRHPVHPRAGRQPGRSSTSTAARSRSATRSACPAPGWSLTLALELQRRGGGTRRGGAVRRRRPGRRADHASSECTAGARRRHERARASREP